MRPAAFLVPIVALLLLTSSAKPAYLHQQQVSPGGLPEIAPHPQRNGDTVRMWKRAEIRVIPADVAASNEAELQSLRDRVARSEMESARLAPVNGAVREQLSRQRQLIYALLAYAERQDSDRGKSPTALEVQKKLNHMEGQMMCETCHTRVVASHATGAGTK